MTSPRVEIDLTKIRSNTQVLVRRLDRRGITVLGVTKALCGHPKVAKAMLNGGAVGLADARISNVERMRKAGITAPISLIRTPLVSLSDRVVLHCEASYNTEIGVIEKLGAEALRQGRVHDVILMVEMGDLRDGVPAPDLVAFAKRVVSIRGVALKGIAANFACLGGVAPNQSAMAALSALATDLEGVCGPLVCTVSGGSSVSISWALGGSTRGRVNELRLGEAILLGIDPLTGDLIEGLQTNAFKLVAEVIETKIKVHPQSGMEDRCSIRSILAIGHQDVDPGGLTFPANVAFVGATSDHLVVETETIPLKVGSEIHLNMNYAALMRAMSAPDVAKIVLDEKPSEGGAVGKATVLS